ncbi:MAG TPA: MFS transporter [Dehalococcoidia bacterium]|nr:MFS transporter [Dehalococcoidia bacterium]
MSTELRPREALGLIGAWLSLVRSRRTRPYLAMTLCLDAAFGFTFLVALQSYLPEQYGGGAGLAGFALACYGGTKLLTQTAGGHFIDRVGLRAGFIAGFAAVIGAQGIFLAAPIWLPLAAVAAATYGVGAAILWPAITALARAEFAEGERAKLTSALTLSSAGGLALALALGTLLPAGLHYAVAVTITLLFVAGAAQSARGMAPAMAFGESRLSIAPASLIRPLISGRFLFLAIVLLMENAAGSGLMAIYRPFGRDVLGLSLREEVLLLAPAACCLPPALVAGGALSDRLGREPMLLLGLSCAGMAVCGLAASDGLAVAAVLAVVAAVGLGLAVPSLTAAALDLAPAQAPASVLAWFLTFESLGHAAGPAAAGFVASAASVHVAVAVLGCLFLGAVPSGLAAMAAAAFIARARRAPALVPEQPS